MCLNESFKELTQNLQIICDAESLILLILIIN